MQCFLENLVPRWQFLMQDTTSTASLSGITVLTHYLTVSCNGTSNYNVCTCCSSVPDAQLVHIKSTVCAYCAGIRVLIGDNKRTGAVMAGRC